MSNSFSVDLALETMMKNDIVANSKFGDTSASNATNYYSVAKQPEHIFDNKFSQMKMMGGNK